MECCFFSIMKVSEIKIGETYNNIQVLEDLGGRHKQYRVRCVLCGKEYQLLAQHIGVRVSCKKCNETLRYENLAGQRFGRLIAVEHIDNKSRSPLWRCKCDCGEYVNVRAANLKNNTYSCGCLKKELNLNGFGNRKNASIELGVIHKHPLYAIWQGIISRCYKKYNNRYKYYGARGIKVCDRWQGNGGFEHFVNDMGERPSSKHTIDRINPNGDYCPENCRWATYREQNSNRSISILLKYKDSQISISQLCDIIELPYWMVYSKVKVGVDINHIINNISKFKAKERVSNKGYKNFNKIITIDLEKFKKL